MNTKQCYENDKRVFLIGDQDIAIMELENLVITG
jgi:hypothetical protein